ncbi:Flp/Fap pilin component [mine drainage metagenome]|uniref:Flp/Fap pilin component n=1 Tax=mine drainage metagenome TaxID=410659 RepID=A0A1J5R4E3_9ZZZZ
MTYVLSFLRDKRGISAMEYAVLAGLVITALVTVIGTTSSGFLSNVQTLFTDVGSALTTAGGTIKG